MQTSNGVVWNGEDIGPMELTHEYRWNVPVVTYGFDKSFLEFFGESGVAAVEDAIEILNAVPRASEIMLENFPRDTVDVNPAPELQYKMDLKSTTLFYLLQRMGLGSPVQSAFVLRKRHPNLLPDWAAARGSYDEPFWGWGVPEYIAQLNFDPVILKPSRYINSDLYSAALVVSPDLWRMYCYPIEFSMDGPSQPVAESPFTDAVGGFYRGLTRDDAGGLRYLLASTNINYETLLPDVRGGGDDPNAFVNGAWRPGVGKVTFVRHPLAAAPGQFEPFTNSFVDTYFVNGNPLQQQLKRTTLRPDFLFSAGFGFSVTGTSNWINAAALNGNPDGGGPGIITPPVTITFERQGKFFVAYDSQDSAEESVRGYASFDASTNAPILYPVPQEGTVSMNMRILLSKPNPDKGYFPPFDWILTSPAKTAYALQTSTNLNHWTTLFSVTNDGSVCYFINGRPRDTRRFYKVVKLD